jgi:type II secretory pathway predicted ATPase ExeA
LLEPLNARSSLQGDAAQKEPPSLIHDEPISVSAEDRFRRAALADRVAAVIGLMAEDGRYSVVAVVGPWGSGKTSLLRLTAARIKADRTLTVAEFNPWLVGNVEALVQDFFASLLSAIDADGRAAKRIRGVVSRYGAGASVLIRAVPVAGKAFSAVLEAAVAWLNKEPSLAERRRDAEEALRELPRPVLIVVDDLDRLQGDELMTVFKLIRLVGRLPNVHYLLAFDDETIAGVVAQQPVAKNDRAQALSFLEKVVQVRFDIPPLHTSEIDDLVEEALSAALRRANASVAAQDLDRFRSVYDSTLRRQLTQPRQVKRLLAQVEVTLPLVVGEVNVVDFILLTFVRVTYPRLYGRLAQSAERLLPSVASALQSRNEHPDQRRQRWQEFVSECGVADVDRVLQVLAELFPEVAAVCHGGGAPDATLRAERRVGAPEYFDRYFQFAVPPDDVPDSKVRLALAALADDSDGDLVAWLDAAVLSHRNLVLGKMEALWERPEPLATKRLLEFLVRVYPDSRKLTGSFMNAGFRIESWFSQMVNSASVDHVDDLVHTVGTAADGLRLATRALGRAARGGLDDRSAAFGRAAMLVMERLEDVLRVAAGAPVSENEDVVWMLHDAVAFGDRSVIRGWLREVLDASAWTTREFVGCFMPLTYIIGGRGPSPPALGDFAVEALADLVPLSQVFGTLEADLDAVVPHSNSVVDAVEHARDVSFDNRVRQALVYLAALRERGPAEPAPAAMSIDQLHPARWLPPRSSQAADLAVRVAVALPRAVAVGNEDEANRRLEEREAVVAAALDTSSITEWLRQQQSVWHWQSGDWNPTGAGGGGLLESVFVPDYSTGRTPLTARFGVLIGSADPNGSRPAVQAVLDIYYDLLELDRGRRPGDIRHETTPPPAPAALSLDELVDLLEVAFTLPELARVVAQELSAAGADEGELGLWVTTRGITIDRVLKLDGLERRLGGTDRSEWSYRMPWLLRESIWGEDEYRRRAIGFIRKMVEASGYRDTDTAFCTGQRSRRGKNR